MVVDQPDLVGDEEMAAKEHVEAVLDEGFAERHDVRAQSNTRFSVRMQHLDNESTQGDQHVKRLIGAEAQNLLEQHGLGNLIVQIMAALKGARAFPPETKD